MIADQFFELGGQPVLKVPSSNQAFLVSFVARHDRRPAGAPYAKRRPKDKKASWGEAMLARCTCSA